MPIEQFASEFERIVTSGQDIEELASGFGLDMGPAEGPVWWKEGGYLLLSDIGNNRRMKWTPGQGVTRFHEPTNRTNGLTRDRQGRLLAFEHDARRVTRVESDGSITVIANRYHDRRLNRPNDVVVKSDGSIHFTDPMTFNVASELDFCGVYRVSPDLGTINVLARDWVLPNGLAFSPDESILYIFLCPLAYDEALVGAVRVENILSPAEDSPRMHSDLGDLARDLTHTPDSWSR